MEGIGEYPFFANRKQCGMPGRGGGSGSEARRNFAVGFAAGVFVLRYPAGIRRFPAVDIDLLPAGFSAFLLLWLYT